MRVLLFLFKKKEEFHSIYKEEKIVCNLCHFIGGFVVIKTGFDSLIAGVSDAVVESNGLMILICLGTRGLKDDESAVGAIERRITRALVDTDELLSGVFNSTMGVH